MARRNDHSPDQLRQLTILHTRQLLMTQPANELSLRKLAKGVGYSPGTLINLFGSYNLLLLAVNADTLDELKQQLDEALNSSLDSRQKLRQLALGYLSFAKQHPHRWRLVFEHRLAQDEALPDWQSERIERLFTSVDAQLRALNPALSDARRQLATRTLWASVHGICQLVLEEKLFASIAISGEEMIDNLLTAYLANWCHLSDKVNN